MVRKLTDSMPYHSASSGFTIIELLVVIVVIAILASITIVSYSGIQGRAYDVTVQSDLYHTYERLQFSQTDNGIYPLTTDMAALQPILIASRSAYDTTTNAYLYCRSDTDTAVIARGKSKTGFYYGSKDQGTIAVGSWTGVADTTCSLAGIATTDAGYASLWYSTGSSWAW